EGRMDCAVIELDTLPDPIRPAAEDHDFLPWRDVTLVLVFVRRIQIRRVSGELGAARIDCLVARDDSGAHAATPHLFFGRARELCDANIGKAELLCASHALWFQAELRFQVDDLADVVEKPRIDFGNVADLLGRQTLSIGFRDVPEPASVRYPQL